MAKKNKEELQYLGVEEFASIVGYSSRQIRRLIHTGRIRASRAPERRKWQIQRSEVSRFRGEPRLINEQSTISEVEVKQGSTPAERISQAQIDPSIVIQRGEHYEQLADVAKSLLANDLESVLEKQTKTQLEFPPGLEEYQVDYTLQDQEGTFYTLDKEELSLRLDDNLQSTFDKYKDWFVKDCFIPHLEAELPKEIASEGLWDGVIYEKPYELIHVLRVLAARRTFKGTCPVCKDW